MAHFNTPVKDWTVRLSPEFRTKRKRYGDKTLQQGVMDFTKKHKKGPNRTQNAGLLMRPSEKRSYTPAPTLDTSGQQSAKLLMKVWRETMGDAKFFANFDRLKAKAIDQVLRNRGKLPKIQSKVAKQSKVIGASPCPPKINCVFIA